MSLDRPGNHGSPTEGAEVAVLHLLALFCSCPSVRWNRLLRRAVASLLVEVLEKRLDGWE